MEAGIYADNDTSAFSGAKRPEYERLTNDIRLGYIDCVVAQVDDRLHRSPRELEDFISLIESTGCMVVTVRNGVLDLTSSQGRAVARIYGVLARSESEEKSLRLRRKHEEIARNGKVSGGGRRPFGFEKDRVTVREDEAELIRSAAHQVLSGRSLGSICSEWNSQGIPTTGGGAWQTSVLRRMLLSKRLGGKRSLRDIEADAEWPAILAPEEVTSLERLLNDPSRRKNRQGSPYLLTGGIAVCGLCGTKLIARPKANRKRNYVCPSSAPLFGCGKISCAADPLEDAVAEMVFVALDSERLDQVLEAGDGRSGEASELGSLQSNKIAKLKELGDMFREDEISRAEYVRLSRPLEEEIASLEQRIAAASSYGPLQAIHRRGAKALRESWGGLEMERRKAIVSAVLVSVPVMPVAIRGSNRFDAKRIGAPIWRF